MSTAKHNPFQGTGIALVTPFNAAGAVDHAGLTRLVQHCIDGGVNFLVALGTTAESATLTKAEKAEVVQNILTTNAGRLPVVLGVGGNNTVEVCDALRQVPAGVDGILSVSPYYNKPSQEGIYQHYKAVSAYTDLPIILYNVPGRTSSNVSAETTLRIAADCPNVVATKEASGNMEQIMAIVNGAPAGFEVLSGDDNLTLPMIACGATGVISVSGQGFPRIFSQMVADARASKLAEAQKGHYALFPFTQLLFAEGNPGGIKSALEHLGVCESHLRLPLWKVSTSLHAKMRETVKGIRSGN
ncbi:MAG: 4-hydroxy-tetrahydrodipicolinate synthase [Flavobacteriia bacterium]|nr:4-hydroxy-tetrahydrodipicolinate synthase [Flavobacteriia bacterium]